MYVHPPGGGNFPDGGSGMTYWSAILLGIIQGLAEFLPISSSGHLAILQNFLRIGDLENQMLFDVLLHLGTLGAVILAYRTQLKGLCREGLAMLHIKKLRRGVKPDLPRRRLLLFLIAATLPLIPAALLNDWLDPLFYNTFFIGFALIVTGFLLLAADRFGHGNKTEKAMTLSDAMVIGLAQMIAVVPGLSRSGSTIAAGMALGLDRKFAVRFSFLLSLPAVHVRHFLFTMELTNILLYKGINISFGLLFRFAKFCSYLFQNFNSKIISVLLYFLDIFAI